MELIEARIKNFRSIADVKIQFDPRCRVLVGINESGKSNVLHALALLDKNRKPTPDDLRTFPPDEDPSEEAFVMFVFSLSSDERKTAYDSFCARFPKIDFTSPILKFKGAPITLQKFFNYRTQGLYRVDVRTGNRRNSTWRLTSDFESMADWKKPTASCPPEYIAKLSDGSAINLKAQSLIEISKFVGIPEKYLADLEPEDVNSIYLDEISKIINQELPDCLHWTYSEAHLLPAQIPIDTFAANSTTCEPLRHMFALADIYDIPKEIAAAKARQNGIRNLLNRVAERATKHMQSVWKDYKTIKIELIQNGGNIDASIKDEHNVYNFSRRSDGFKRFVTFLLMVSAKQRTAELVNTLYLHDEPDNGLHPGGCRQLRDELIKISRNNYVVVSTHSIFMIDREKIERHLIVEKIKKLLLHEPLMNRTLSKRK